MHVSRLLLRTLTTLRTAMLADQPPRMRSAVPDPPARDTRGRARQHNGATAWADHELPPAVTGVNPHGDERVGESATGG
jgi:hypothetical protein